jgi:hypothetical protein
VSAESFERLPFFHNASWFRNGLKPIDSLDARSLRVSRGQGDSGDLFFVMISGQADVIVDDKKVPPILPSRNKQPTTKTKS